MKTVIFLWLAAVAVSGFAEDEPAPAADRLQWIFLNVGPGREKTKGMPQAQLKQMQADHVGNFGKLFEQGRLLAAGPLGDNGSIRGIVLLNQGENLKDCFKPDPYVQNDILAVEAHPWAVDVLKFGPPVVPFKMAQHTLCIVKKGPDWQAGPPDTRSDAMIRLLPKLKALAEAGELAVSGPFLDGDEKLGLLLFYSNAPARFKAELEPEPAVAENRVVLEFHPQFMGRGTLANPAENNAPPKRGKAIVLFDGRSFAGWEGDTKRTWRVVDGALVGGSLTTNVPHNDFLCTTNEFKNFDLRLQVKLTGTGFVNGGIQVRSQRLKEPAYEMTGYQADMGESYWGSLYDESRRNKTLAHTHSAVIRHIFKPDDWNDYIVRCEDRHIRLWLNGVLTADYTEDDNTIPLTGFIGLQIHGGGKAEASYRQITIEELF